jgi:hypothetical protein
LLSSNTFRLAVWPTQPPVQWVLGVLSLGVKPPRREADHSPPGTAWVMRKWSYTSGSRICLRGMLQGHFTFYLCRMFAVLLMDMTVPLNSVITSGFVRSALTF